MIRSVAEGLIAAALMISAASAYEPVIEYDPARDAAKDVAEAVAEAKSSGRLVLLEVGGEWCIWCHYLDDFLAEQSEIRAAWNSTFVAVKVNFSQENQNKELLSRFPKPLAYPVFFILDGDGKFLDKQSTGTLERGRSYGPKRFMKFIERWEKRRSGS